MAGDGNGVQRQERGAGLLLMAAAAVALIAANSGLADAYHALLDYKLGPVLPRLGRMSVHHWIADGLMALFFLLVGLEVKREWHEGRLSTAAERKLPIVAAAAGMAVPALVFLAFTRADPALARGWAIPSATDIAFAIGILALLGSRANPAIKLLLVTIAIVDDIGAVVIIALAYTDSLDGTAIAAALAILAALAGLNRLGVQRLWPYLLGFALLWVAMLASGIHATIAGVLAALAVPLGNDDSVSPLKRLEQGLHPWVMFGVVPLFGLASAGVGLPGLSALLEPLPLGIAAGLFVGKQAGVFGALWLADRTAFARRPEHVRWSELYGASLLCGVGFTMSLFIAALAFPASPQLVEDAKIGVLAGSLASGLLGYLVLRLAGRPASSEEDRDEADEIFGADGDRRT